MSLHYGVSKNTYEAVKVRTLNYTLFFIELRRGRDSYPVNVSTGYPFVKVYCRGWHPDGGFKILTHTFDKDNKITAPFSVRLKIKIYLDDGTTQLIDLEDVNYYGADVINCERMYFLERGFKFKDINKKKTGSANIVAFETRFRQLTGGAYGNESAMDIVVDY